MRRRDGRDEAQQQAGRQLTEAERQEVFKVVDLAEALEAQGRPHDMKWIDTKKIFYANMPAIYETDAWTGLSPFMLAAVGAKSDLESVYRLCREYPVAIYL